MPLLCRSAVFRSEGELIDISVCLVNWNCRELLRACLDSLTQQPQGVRAELIVVDNGSTDGAAALVAREYPDVQLLRNVDNVGFARANNQAARRACGRYLLFLNNDTVVPAGTLRQLLDYAEAHPQVGLLGPRLVDAQQQTQISYRRRPTVGTLLHRCTLLRWTRLLRGAYRQYRRPPSAIVTPRPVDVLMGAAMLVPRATFEQCGGWDERFAFGGEDIDLSIRIGKHWEVVYLPDVAVIHHGRMSTRQQAGFAATQIMAGTIRYLRKHGTSEGALWVYKILQTLDAPLQIVEKGVQALWRRLQGRAHDAAKSWLIVQAATHFLGRGLRTFWTA